MFFYFFSQFWSISLFLLLSFYPVLMVFMCHLPGFKMCFGYLVHKFTHVSFNSFDDKTHDVWYAPSNGSLNSPHYKCTFNRMQLLFSSWFLSTSYHTTHHVVIIKYNKVTSTYYSICIRITLRRVEISTWFFISVCFIDLSPCCFTPTTSIFLLGFFSFFCHSYTP